MYNYMKPNPVWNQQICYFSSRDSLGRMSQRFLFSKKALKLLPIKAPDLSENKTPEQMQTDGPAPSWKNYFVLAHLSTPTTIRFYERRETCRLKLSLEKILKIVHSIRGEAEKEGEWNEGWNCMLVHKLWQCFKKIIKFTSFWGFTFFVCSLLVGDRD